MKLAKHVVGLTLFVILSVGLIGSLELNANAQEHQPLKLDFVTAGTAGPPSIDVLSDGTLIFKITALNQVSGDLTGMLTEEITQIYPLSDEGRLLPITVSWKLVTSDGTIEGYYSGTFQHMQSGDHMITQHGEVLSVTGAYVNLYQAKVQYQAVLLADHMTGSGTMTIHPNERR